VESKLDPLGTSANSDLLYLPRVIARVENLMEEDWQGKSKYTEKICPSATLSTTDPTWPHPGVNPCRRDGKPATNRLSYGAALPCQV
jgi:hypothetical protein